MILRLPTWSLYFPVNQTKIALNPEINEPTIPKDKCEEIKKDVKETIEKYNIPINN